MSDICTFCGGDHWRPDCPEIADLVKLQSRLTASQARVKEAHRLLQKSQEIMGRTANITDENRTGWMMQEIENFLNTVPEKGK